MPNIFGWIRHVNPMFYAFENVCELSTFRLPFMISEMTSALRQRVLWPQHRLRR